MTGPPSSSMPDIPRGTPALFHCAAKNTVVRIGKVEQAAAHGDPYMA
jgi:hypothetical protein